MTLRLILIRHAKSDWNSPATEDFDRPLNQRGVTAASDIGKWLLSRGHVPETILCSAATRTRETCERIIAELGTQPQTDYRQSLYLASADMMLQAVCELKGAKTALMLAHNPGCSVLATALAEKPPAHPQFDDYPTAATSVFEFFCDDWAQLLPGSGQVVDFVVPRDL